MKVTNRLTLLIAVSTLPLISNMGAANPQESVRKNFSQVEQENYKQELLNLENRWLQAEDDPAILESILAPDFLHVLPEGIISKDQQLAFIRKHSKPKTRVAKQFEDLHIRIYGTVGVVNGVVRATEMGTTCRTLFTDVFVRRHGRWGAVSAQELPAANQTH